MCVSPLHPNVWTAFLEYLWSPSLIRAIYFDGVFCCFRLLSDFRCTRAVIQSMVARFMVDTRFHVGLFQKFMKMPLNNVCAPIETKAAHENGAAKIDLPMTIQHKNRHSFAIALACISQITEGNLCAEV